MPAYTKDGFAIGPHEVEVTEDEFYAFMNPNDVTPYCRSENYMSWVTPRGDVIGRSYPGWKNPGGKKLYLLTK